MAPSPTMREYTPEVVNSPPDTIIMDMEPDQQSSDTIEAPTDGPSDPEWGEWVSPMVHTTWTSTTTAMAKCDSCQRGSRGTLQQCRDCSLAICQECFDAGLLDCRHRLDADRVDWNQHNKPSKNKASRATSRVASSSAAVSVGTSAVPQSQEQGNNEYTSIQPSSAIEQTETETENNWNSQFSQPPGQHREYLNGFSGHHDVTLASSEDPSSWNNSFSQSPAQHHQVSSAYYGSAPATAESPNSWDGMFDQPQTGHQHDQMQSFQNSSASSAYPVNQPIYHDHQQLIANFPMPSHQAPSSGWQPYSSPYTSASESGLYYPDLSNYALVSIAVAPASFPRSHSRVRSTPRVLPDMSPNLSLHVSPNMSPDMSLSTSPSMSPSTSMPVFIPPYALQHEPAGPPRRYEDYFNLH